MFGQFSRSAIAAAFILATLAARWRLRAEGASHAGGSGTGHPGRGPVPHQPPERQRLVERRGRSQSDRADQPGHARAADGRREDRLGPDHQGARTISRRFRSTRKAESSTYAVSLQDARLRRVGPGEVQDRPEPQCGLAGEGPDQGRRTRRMARDPGVRHPEIVVGDNFQHPVRPARAERRERGQRHPGRRQRVDPLPRILRGLAEKRRRLGLSSGRERHAPSGQHDAVRRRLQPHHHRPETVRGDREAPPRRHDHELRQGRPEPAPPARHRLALRCTSA